MKRVLCVLILALAAVHAQAANKNEQISRNNICDDEVFVSVGTYVPLYKDINADVMAGIHYGHTWKNGLGLRAGFQYTLTTADISNQFGLPLAFTFKTKSRNTAERLQSGFEGAYNAVENELFYASGANNADGSTARNLLAAFFMNLYDRMEFHLGFTPGYIQGSSTSRYESSWGDGYRYSETHWTEKQHSFYLTADLGFDINFRIWRFNLKLMPAFHWNITDNWRWNSISVDSGNPGGPTTGYIIRPLNWFFSFSGALSFNF